MEQEPAVLAAYAKIVMENLGSNFTSGLRNASLGIFKSRWSSIKGISNWGKTASGSENNDMDVFQTDWKEKHESRGTQKPPTLLNVWQGYLGEEDESTVLERINVPTIFHPDQELYHVNRDLERRPDGRAEGRAELRSPRDAGREGRASVGSERRGSSPGKEEEPSNSGVSPEVPEKKEVLKNESKDNTTTNGSMFGSVFGSVFQKKDTPQATEQNGNVPPEVSVSPVIPDVSSVGVNSLQNKEDSQAEKVILEFDLRHPTIEEGAEPPDSGAGGLRSEETVSSSTRGGTREYTSDEATSSVLSTEPSTTSRPRNKSMFGRLALFMKRPKRRRLRKGSLEGTSGESSASNGVYQDTARPSIHSSMSLGAGNTNVKSDSPPPNIRESSLPTRSQSVPVNQCHLISLSSSPTHNTSSKPSNSHRTRQFEISEQSETLKVNKRRSRDLPTEDYVLSDPEPEPALTTPRFAPYRAASVADDNTCTPLPCTPLTNKNKKTRSSKNKQSSRPKQTFSSKDSDSSYYSSRKSSTTSRSKNKTRSHQKQGSRNNRQVRSKGRVSCRHEESTPINLFERGVEPQVLRGTNSQVQKGVEIPPGMPALGRMLDNRGRCSMYPTSSSCPGTSIFDFLTWDEDTDSEFSTNTSLRKDSSSSSEGSITSLPSLATFHPDLPSLPPRPTQSADIFRNQVKPIGREGWERSRSVNDMRSPNSLSSAVTNFAVVRSPTKLTPPPPRRHHGDIFCLPNCFTPVNFDKAMLLE